ncbi:MAG: sulfatase modifying factor 1 [Pirellulaceae bacterium]|jgi:sulfatase modifying factor 1
MKRILGNQSRRFDLRPFTLVLSVIVGLTTVVATSVQAAEKYALLVGITQYRHDRMNDSKLKFPEADAASVADLLRQSGYSVDVLLGQRATRTAILAALTSAGNEGTSKGAVVLGFFGHGVQYGEKAYFAPYDSSIRVVKDSQNKTVRDDNGQPKWEPDPDSMISMRVILDALTTCGAGNRVLLADCCREDPSRARGRAFGTTLTTQDLPPGTVAMFACSANEQAFEHDDWKHGAFTYAFLEHTRAMAQSGKVLSGTLSDNLYESVGAMVREKTNGRSKQTVYAFSSGTVDFQLTPSRRPGDESSDNGLKMKFCWIPAGKFTMGSPETEKDRSGDEPQVNVTISRGFSLGKYEVTQGEWHGLMQTKPWDGKGLEREGDRYPASYVSWEDALLFCEKLTSRERSAGRLSQVEEYRLPTEAEWEYACRSGTTAAFSFGSDDANLKEYAWCGGPLRGNEKNDHYAHQVGGKLANAWRLHDMHGNVSEWCLDWYAAEHYGSGSLVDPAGPVLGSYRVSRGGSWYSSPQRCRSANRNWFTPDFRHYRLGFRVLRSSVK